jgi:hypothetical protein
LGAVEFCDARDETNVIEGEPQCFLADTGRAGAGAEIGNPACKALVLI